MAAWLKNLCRSVPWTSPAGITWPMLWPPARWELRWGLLRKRCRKGIESVQGIPHRLEFVLEKNGIRWYNDSIATAPERVMAAIEAIDTPLVLLLGGRDKDLPWEELAGDCTRSSPK